MTQRRPHAPRHDADHLTSRERELENIERTLVFMSDDPGLEGRIKVFEGARDADKTMFLRAVQKLAEERNFSTIWASAGDGVFLDFLLRECGRISGTWAESARQKFSVIATWKLPVSPNPRRLVFELACLDSYKK